GGLRVGSVAQFDRDTFDWTMNVEFDIGEGEEWTTVHDLFGGYITGVTGTNFEVRVSQPFPIPQPTGTDGGSGDGGTDAGGDAGEVADGGTDPVTDAGMDASSDANSSPDANDQPDEDAGHVAADANGPDANRPTTDSGPAGDSGTTPPPPTETPNKPDDPSCLGCNATDSGTTPETIIATIAAAVALRRRRRSYDSIE
ncbi:MAG: hypothetical protein AAB592_00900, partial [Patescibacteria group bacterium]